MKAGYGQSLRNHISSNYDPIQLIDFANNKIFDSATVLVNILSIIKRGNLGKTKACSIEDNFDITKLSDYVETHIVNSILASSGSWSILSDIEKSIKAKIEAVGTPLKDWDVHINYGIKTGCNDAFIVDSVKRNEILNNCITEEERQKTAEIIRPCGCGTAGQPNGLLSHLRSIAQVPVPLCGVCRSCLQVWSDTRQ